MCRNHRIKRLVPCRCLVRLGYCFTPYRRQWLYNGAPLVAFNDTLGIRRTYSPLNPPASSRGCLDGHSARTLRNVYDVGSPTVGTTSSVRLHICAVTYMTEISLHVTLNTNNLKLPIYCIEIGERVIGLVIS